MAIGGSRLSPLQERLVVMLADVTPQWTLTGGAAEQLALSAGWDQAEAAAIEQYRRWLIDRLLVEAAPDA